MSLRSYCLPFFLICLFVQFSQETIFSQDTLKDLLDEIGCYSCKPFALYAQSYLQDKKDTKMIKGVAYSFCLLWYKSETCWKGIEL